MNNRGILIKTIHSYLALFTQHVKQLNASGLYDINKDSENTAIAILNSVYDLDLKNANNILSENFPAVDLIDDNNKIVIQVTSDSDASKIIYTINKFVEKRMFEKYNLYIYLLVDKLKYYKPTEDKINELIGDKFLFSIKENVIDNKILGKKISNLISINKIISIEKVLVSEFSRNSHQLLEPISNEKPKFLFDYRNKNTDFLGRDEEIGLLREFYDSKSYFSWWIITGKAGSGKSRLALEFGNILGGDGVRFGFLHSRSIKDFDVDVSSSRNVFIVIDYARTEYKELIELITKFGRRENYEKKVRLLLIEREAKGDWWKDMIDDIYISKYLFDENPLEVNGLHEEILFSIVKNIVSNKNILINVEHNRHEIIDSMKKLDSLQRPLFAMFIGIALANDQYISNWNQHNLLEFITDEEYRLTKNTFKYCSESVIDKHRNLLALSTVCYGLTGYEIETIFKEKFNWIPTLDEFDGELYDFISHGSIIDIIDKEVSYKLEGDVDENKKVIQLFPLMPDVLGEYFVLKKISINEKYVFKTSSLIEEFVKIAENINHYYYFNFVRRAIQDFPAEKSVINFLIGNKKSSVDNREISSSIVLDYMRNLYYNNMDVMNVLWSYIKILFEIKNERTDQYHMIDDVDRVYQEACQLMVSKYNDDLPKQLFYYEIVKANTDRIEATPKVFIDSSPRYHEDIDIEDLMSEFDKIENKDYAKSYLEKHTVSDQRIAHLEVCVIYNIISVNVSNMSTEMVNKFIERLLYLCNNFSDPRIKKDTLIIFLEYGPDKIPNFLAVVANLYETILKTENQPSPINIHLEQFIFTETIIKYLLSVSEIYIPVVYYLTFRNFLLSKKPSKNIANIFVEMALLAERCAKYMYEIDNLFLGDKFYNEIIGIYHIFGRSAEWGSPITDIVNRVQGYRNGN